MWVQHCQTVCYTVTCFLHSYVCFNSKKKKKKLCRKQRCIAFCFYSYANQNALYSTVIKSLWHPSQEACFRALPGSFFKEQISNSVVWHKRVAENLEGCAKSWKKQREAGRYWGKWQYKKHDELPTTTCYCVTCFLKLCWRYWQSMSGPGAGEGWVMWKLLIAKCMHSLYIYMLLLLFKYSCLHFPTITFLCPTHPHLPPLIIPPSGFVHGSFVHVPWWPFPFFPHYPSPRSPLVTVSLFFISMSLVLFCLLVGVLLIRFHL